MCKDDENASGIRLVSLAADRETDVERQYQIIENLIQQDVDAILLAPSGSKELVPAISKANDAGIPVLLIDTRIDEAAAEAAGAKVLTYIGSDNFEYRCQDHQLLQNVVILVDHAKAVASIHRGWHLPRLQPVCAWFGDISRGR